MNRAINRDEHVSEIRAIPLLAGVKSEKKIVRMSEMPKIPNKAMTYEEMGEFMDSYQAEVKEKSSKSSSNSKLEKQWQNMKKKADNDIEQIDDQYDMILKEVEGMSDK